MLLYKLLARRLPFAEDGELISVLYRRVHEQPRQLLEVAPDVPAAIARVTMRTLASEPGDRIASAEDLGAELARAASAAWGPDWLRRSGLTVLASGRIADRLSAAGAGRGQAARPAVPEPAPKDVVPLRDALAGGGPPAAAPRRRMLDRRVGGALAAAGVAVCVLGALVAAVHLPRPSAVAAAAPRPSPSAVTAPGALVYSDDFANPGSGWVPDAGQAGAGTADLAADGYHVVALQPQNVLNTFSVASPDTSRLASMAAVADGTLLAGAPADGWGVRCDQGGRAGLRYTFEFHGDGSWVIFRIDDRGSAALAQGASQAIRTGRAVNSVRGDCTELPTGATRLTMWVNGAQVGQATDDHPGLSPRWHAALVLYRGQSGPAAEVRFTRFREYDLSRGPR
jgi:hypothetical protein